MRSKAPHGSQNNDLRRYFVIASMRCRSLLSKSTGCYGDFLFTPIYRFNSPRPFNILAGGRLNGDRHNTTDRPYFAGHNIGVGPNFWTFDMRLSRRFAVRERSSVEFMFEAFNLFNRLNFASVNNTVSCVPVALSAAGVASGGLQGTPGSCYINDVVQRYGGLSGQGRYGPSQAFGFCRRLIAYQLGVLASAPLEALKRALNRSPTLVAAPESKRPYRARDQKRAESELSTASVSGDWRPGKPPG